MRKVTIIGAGPGNPDLLSRAALDAIDIADVVIGAHRALAGIDVPPDVVRCELVKTADIVAALTDAASWQRAVVVMTGDVGLFSGARRLVEALSPATRRWTCASFPHKLSVVSRRAPRASMAGLALWRALTAWRATSWPRPSAQVNSSSSRRAGKTPRGFRVSLCMRASGTRA